MPEENRSMSVKRVRAWSEDPLRRPMDGGSLSQGLQRAGRAARLIARSSQRFKSRLQYVSGVVPPILCCALIP